MPGIVRSGVFSGAKGRVCPQLEESSNDLCVASPCGDHKRSHFIRRAVNLGAMLDEGSYKNVISGLSDKHQCARIAGSCDRIDICASRDQHLDDRQLMPYRSPEGCPKERGVAALIVLVRIVACIEEFQNEVDVGVVSGYVQIAHGLTAIELRGGAG